ncbi:MAG: histone deacetylase [Candidatus Thorarchaeota archaeon]|nr:MAG: histone deacetylase [Candidatus Thorarchaeota archaeon]
MATDVVYHDVFVKHQLSPGHPESPERLKSALMFLERGRLLEDSDTNLFTPSRKSIDHIMSVHSMEYLDVLRRTSESGGGFFTLDTSANEYTYEAAIMAANGSVETVERIQKGIIQNAYVLCRPPGHHAESNRAFGFCFVNNIAVAANYLVEFEGLDRVMIIDYDAHHGNGTQNTFYSSNKILYVGLHQDGRTLFPGSGFPDEIGKGEGEGYNVNLSMYPGAGDLSYGIAFEQLIWPIVDSFKPQFILVSVGFDGHVSDPLTSLGLTRSGFSMMNRELNSMAKSHASGKVAFFLEGGYNIDIVGSGSQNLVEELAGKDVTLFAEKHEESKKSVEYSENLIIYLQEKLDGILL